MSEGSPGPASNVSTISTGMSEWPGPPHQHNCDSSLVSHCTVLRFLPLNSTAGVTTVLVDNSLSQPVDISITGGLPFGPELHKAAYVRECCMAGNRL